MMYTAERQAQIQRALLYAMNPTERVMTFDQQRQMMVQEVDIELPLDHVHEAVPGLVVLDSNFGEWIEELTRY